MKRQESLCFLCKFLQSFQERGWWSSQCWSEGDYETKINSPGKPSLFCTTHFPWDTHGQPGLHFWSGLNSATSRMEEMQEFLSCVEAALVFSRKTCPKGVSTTTHSVHLQFKISLKAFVFEKTNGWCKIMLNHNTLVLCPQVLNQKILLQDVIKNRLRYGVSHQWFAIIIWCGDRNDKYNPCWTAHAFAFVFSPRYFWFAISPFSWAALEPFLEQKGTAAVQPV